MNERRGPGAYSRNSFNFKITKKEVKIRIGNVFLQERDVVRGRRVRERSEGRVRSELSEVTTEKCRKR